MKHLKSSTKKQFIVAFKDHSGNVEMWKFPDRESMLFFCERLRARGLDYVCTTGSKQ